MELSLSQGCTSPPVNLFSPYVQPVFPLLQISAIASWPSPGQLREPGSIQSLARPQGVKGSNYPPPLPVHHAQLRHEITTLVGLWYQLPPQADVHLRHPKEPFGSGMCQKLPGLKILGSTFLFLTPRVFGYRNVCLCHPCCVICRGL